MSFWASFDISTRDNVHQYQCTNAKILWIHVLPFFLTLGMLNKLRCYAYFYFPASQITWSGFLIEIHLFNDKRCRSRSVGFRSASALFAKTGHVMFSKRRVKIFDIQVTDNVIRVLINVSKISTLRWISLWNERVIAQIVVSIGLYRTCINIQYL